MNRQERADAADAAWRCIAKCRDAESPEAWLASQGKRWNSALRRAFETYCSDVPEAGQAAEMLRAEGRAELARELLPDLERFMGQYAFSLIAETSPRPAGGLRPVLVVDNTAGKAKGSPAHARSKGNRAASRPAGDAA